MKFIKMIILFSALVVTIAIVSELKDDEMEAYSEYFLSYVGEDGYTFVNGDEKVLVESNKLQGYEMYNSIWIKFDDKNNLEVQDIKLH